MIKLIIARHGNTFGPGDIPTRVGAKTDIPLVESGHKQAQCIGEYFRREGIVPDVVFSSELQRARQTAEGAMKVLGDNFSIETLDIFNEIDYGPDENKTEEEVVARVGQGAIDAWNDHALVPEGWDVDPEGIVKNWLDFAAMLKKSYEGKTVFVVTSNGIARFAPYITGDFEEFCKNHSIKIKTGALCIFENNSKGWEVLEWNLRS